MSMKKKFPRVVGVLVLCIIAVWGATSATKMVALICQKECIKCGKCFRQCPVKAITKIEKRGNVERYVIDSKKCIGCGLCIKSCPVKAIGWAQYNPKTGVCTLVKDTTVGVGANDDSSAANKKATAPSRASQGEATK